MPFGEAIATCFRKYATFSGRARPSEFWWWVLFLVILAAVLGALAGATGSIDQFGNLEPNSGMAGLIGILWLGLIIPHLAVTVRRLHDTGRSGWFLLLGLIPCIGGILLLVFYTSAGDPGPNKYGDPPQLPSHAMPPPQMSVSLPAAGWYPDPTGVGNRQAYWDGKQWTGHFHDDSPGDATPPNPDTKPKRSGWFWGTIILAAVVIGSVAVVAVISVMVAGSELSETFSEVASELDSQAEPPASPDVAFGTPTVEGEPLPTYASGSEDMAIGAIAPSAQGADWNGNPVTIEPDGTPKIVVFLAHWCPHCQADVPVIQQWIDEGNLPDDVEMISISTLANELRDNFPPAEWLDGVGWTPPVMMDSAEGTLALAFGLGATPQFMVLDGENTNLLRVTGEMTAEQLDLLVDIAQESIAG